jgi:hypothetical protein
MLQIDRTTTLHVFPTHGAWSDTDDVMIVTTVGDLPVSESYNYVAYNYGEHLVRRDTVFMVLSDPIFRSKYDDVIVYAEPYTSLWCTLCEDDRYPLVRDGVQGEVSICDACGCLLDAPF